MSERLSGQRPFWLRPKSAVFVAIAVMTLYVLYHNERFLIEPENPIWRHYAEIAFWLVPHAAPALCPVLAPCSIQGCASVPKAHHIDRKRLRDWCSGVWRRLRLRPVLAEALATRASSRRWPRRWRPC